MLSFLSTNERFGSFAKIKIAPLLFGLPGSGFVRIGAGNVWNQ
jgi:hypothetical protein